MGGGEVVQGVPQAVNQSQRVARNTHSQEEEEQDGREGGQAERPNLEHALLLINLDHAVRMGVVQLVTESDDVPDQHQENHHHQGIREDYVKETVHQVKMAELLDETQQGNAAGRAVVGDDAHCEADVDEDHHGHDDHGQDDQLGSEGGAQLGRPSGSHMHDQTVDGESHNQPQREERGHSIDKGNELAPAFAVVQVHVNIFQPEQ